MIYITGDTHGDFKRFSKKRMKQTGMELTEKDYIIVCGDLGLCWEKDKTFEYHCKYFEERDYTILWVQGNHENYDMIAEFPLEEWHGGKVRHIVRNRVILLERGQVFAIEGKTFFTFGGASSHDIQGGILDKSDPNYEIKKKMARKRGLAYRINHESWWEQELPNEEEMNEGRKNLGQCDYQVDYVITHCCANSVQDIIESGPGKVFSTDVLTDYFQELEEKLTYKHWFFGHYHMERAIDDKHSLLYHAIVPLENNSL